MASVAVFIAFALGLAVGSLVQRWLEYERRRARRTKMLRDIFGDEWDAPAVMDGHFVQTESHSADALPHLRSRPMRWIEVCRRGLPDELPDKLPENVVRGRFER